MLHPDADPLLHMQRLARERGASAESMREQELRVRFSRLGQRRPGLRGRGTRKRDAARGDEHCKLHTIKLFHKRREVSYIPPMPVDPELLEILACPNCKTPVTLVKNGAALKCATCKRVYPIKEDIPVMLIDEATIEND